MRPTDTAMAAAATKWLCYLFRSAGDASDERDLRDVLTKSTRSQVCLRPAALNRPTRTPLNHSLARSPDDLALDRLVTLTKTDRAHDYATRAAASMH